MRVGNEFPAQGWRALNNIIDVGCEEDDGRVLAEVEEQKAAAEEKRETQSVGFSCQVSIAKTNRAAAAAAPPDGCADGNCLATFRGRSRRVNRGNATMR